MSDGERIRIRSVEVLSDDWVLQRVLSGNHGFAARPGIAELLNQEGIRSE